MRELWLIRHGETALNVARVLQPADTPLSARGIAQAEALARRLAAMVANAEAVIGIELLASVQGCEFHLPLHSSDALEAARGLLRSEVPALDEDRHFHPDMEAANAIVRAGRLADVVGLALPGVCE